MQVDHIPEKVNFEKDLGVIIDSDHKFHKQISAVVKKAKIILGLIKRTFTIKDETIPLLYICTEELPISGHHRAKLFVR